MRSKCLALLFAFGLILSNCSAQNYISFDITSPLKLWLLSNEAKAMQEIGLDSALLTHCSSPFAMLPPTKGFAVKAEEKLWEIHRKLYSFMDEVQNIYDLAKHFGSGKFSVSLKQTRPEIWGYSALSFCGFRLPKMVYNETRKGYLDALFIAIGLEVRRDKDLSLRLKVAIKSLRDEEYRLFREYLSAFKSLYPNERSAVQLETFLVQGVTKPFAPGLSDVIKSAESLKAEVFAPNEILKTDDDDPLAELEALTQSSVEEENQTLSTMETPDQDAVDMYDLGL